MRWAAVEALVRLSAEPYPRVEDLGSVFGWANEWPRFTDPTRSGLPERPLLRTYGASWRTREFDHDRVQGIYGGLRVRPFGRCLPRQVIGLQDVVTFEGRSIDDLRHEMEASVDDYLELCEEVGKEPERPYRGEFLFGQPPRSTGRWPLPLRQKG